MRQFYTGKVCARRLTEKQIRQVSVCIKGVEKRYTSDVIVGRFTRKKISLILARRPIGCIGRLVSS